MTTRSFAFFVASLGALSVSIAACSADPGSADPSASPGAAEDPKSRLADGGRDPEASVSAEEDAASSSPDGGPEGWCPTAKTNESIYCQSFDTKANPIGAWTLSGEPSLDDAGAPLLEDGTQFWSAPSSRYLSTFGPGLLRGTATGALPVTETTLRFRLRPSFAPYVTAGTHVAYVALGDSTLALAWLDYGRLDPSKAGTKGYALIHHVYAAGQADTWTEVGMFPAKNVWSAVAMTIRSTGAVSVSFDGVVAASFTAAVSPSTSARFGFGPYYSSSSPSDNPTHASGNIDDVAAVVAR